MKTCKFHLFRPALLIVLAFSLRPVAAADFQLISTMGGSPSASANGDSGLPIISADGRYVVFSSSANNLVLTNSAGPVPSTKLHWQNVFLHDCVSGSNILISANLAGSGGNGNSWPCEISTNGQFVLFESSASDLVTNDNNNADDVFVRDVINGTTRLISVNTNGVSGNGSSHSSSLTPDGHSVVFVSAATDLVANDTNGIADVFVRNPNDTTTCLSSGAVAANSSSVSEAPVITPDGRHIAFYSTATNLIFGNPLTGAMYVCDRLANTIVCVSSNAGNFFQATYSTSNTVCCSPVISDDGRFVSFLVCSASPSFKGMILRYDTALGQASVVHSNAFVPTVTAVADIRVLDQSPDGRFLAFIANNPAGTSGYTIIYLRDATAGTNILVSTDMTTGQAVNGICDTPQVDATGRYVTFICNGFNLTATPLSGPGTHLYRRDVQSGSTQSVDVDANGVAAGAGESYSTSADARFVAFDTPANSFVANDRNGDYDAVVRDLTLATNELISAAHPWLTAWTPDRFCKLYPSCVSTNARFVAFTSEADNLVTNDFNGSGDVFVRDALLGTNILASVGTNGQAGASVSAEPSLSGNGNFVAYSSWATNLVAGDTNKVQDVFVYNLSSGTNLLISATPAGGFGNSNSYSPQINADGSFVLFRSRAQNLTAGTFIANTENLFLRNLALKTNYALTTGTVVNASLTTDGHYVAYVGVAGGSSATNLYVWDSLATKRIYTNTSSALLDVAISPDGRWVAYSSGSTLYAYDLTGKANYTVAAGTFDSRAGLQFSTDDRWLTFVTRTKIAKSDNNSTYDIYLHDFQNNTNILVSQSFNTTNAASSASYFPSLSPDGRFVAFQSVANNLVPNDTNNLADLYVYDRTTGTTILITFNQSGNSTANNLSLTPVFSGDSQSLVFASYAANFPNPSFNEYNAIYALNLFATGDSDGGDIQTNGVSANLSVAGNGSSGQTPGQPPIITWPSVAGKFYQVQFKNDLSDLVWQNLNGSTTQVGAQGQAVDLGATGQSQRFYRIVLSN